MYILLLLILAVSLKNEKEVKEELIMGFFNSLNSLTRAVGSQLLTDVGFNIYSF